MSGKKMLTNSDIRDRRQFEVIRRTEKAAEEYQVGSKNLQLGSSGMIINDAAVAEELYDKHSVQRGDGTLTVIPVEKAPDRGHKRSFLVRLPANYKRGSNE